MDFVEVVRGLVGAEGYYVEVFEDFFKAGLVYDKGEVSVVVEVIILDVEDRFVVGNVGGDYVV